jgi:hypothetical protein
MKPGAGSGSIRVKRASKIGHQHTFRNAQMQRFLKGLESAAVDNHFFVAQGKESCNLRIRAFALSD